MSEDIEIIVTDAYDDEEEKKRAAHLEVIRNSNVNDVDIGRLRRAAEYFSMTGESAEDFAEFKKRLSAERKIKFGEVGTVNHMLTGFLSPEEDEKTPESKAYEERVDARLTELRQKLNKKGVMTYEELYELQDAAVIFQDDDKRKASKEEKAKWEKKLATALKPGWFRRAEKVTAENLPYLENILASLSEDNPMRTQLEGVIKAAQDKLSRRETLENVDREGGDASREAGGDTDGDTQGDSTGDEAGGDGDKDNEKGDENDIPQEVKEALELIRNGNIAEVETMKFIDALDVLRADDKYATEVADFQGRFIKDREPDFNEYHEVRAILRGKDRDQETDLQKGYREEMEGLAKGYAEALKSDNAPSFKDIDQMQAAFAIFPSEDQDMWTVLKEKMVQKFDQLIALDELDVLEAVASMYETRAEDGTVKFENGVSARYLQVRMQEEGYLTPDKDGHLVVLKELDETGKKELADKIEAARKASEGAEDITESNKKIIEEQLNLVGIVPDDKKSRLGDIVRYRTPKKDSDKETIVLTVENIKKLITEGRLGELDFFQLMKSEEILANAGAHDFAEKLSRKAPWKKKSQEVIEELTARENELETIASKHEETEEFSKRMSNFWNNVEFTIDPKLGFEEIDTEDYKKLTQDIARREVEKEILSNGWSSARAGETHEETYNRLYQGYVEQNCVALIMTNASLEAAAQTKDGKPMTAEERKQLAADKFAELLSRVAPEGNAKEGPAPEKFKINALSGHAVLGNRMAELITFGKKWGERTGLTKFVNRVKTLDAELTKKFPVAYPVAKGYAISSGIGLIGGPLGMSCWAAYGAYKTIKTQREAAKKEELTYGQYLRKHKAQIGVLLGTTLATAISIGGTGFAMGVNNGSWSLSNYDLQGLKESTGILGGNFDKLTNMFSGIGSNQLSMKGAANAVWNTVKNPQFIGRTVGSLTASFSAIGEEIAKLHTLEKGSPEWEAQKKLCWTRAKIALTGSALAIVSAGIAGARAGDPVVTTNESATPSIENGDSETSTIANNAGTEVPTEEIESPTSTLDSVAGRQDIPGITPWTEEGSYQVEENEFVTVEYDESGNQIQTTTQVAENGDLTQTRVDAEGNTTVTEVETATITDENGNKVETVTKTVTQTDAQGNQVSNEVETVKESVTALDENGQPTSHTVTETNGDGTKTVTVSAVNDDGNTTITTNQVDENGQPVLDAEGNATTTVVEVDATNGNETTSVTKTAADGTSVTTTIEVDANDQPVLDADGKTTTTVVEVDENGNKTTSVTKTAADGTSVTTTTEVDANGNPILDENGHATQTVIEVDAEGNATKTVTKLDENGQPVLGKDGQPVEEVTSGKAEDIVPEERAVAQAGGNEAPSEIPVEAQAFPDEYNSEMGISERQYNTLVSRYGHETLDQMYTALDKEGVMEMFGGMSKEEIMYKFDRLENVTNRFGNVDLTTLTDGDGNIINLDQAVDQNGNPIDWSNPQNIDTTKVFIQGEDGSLSHIDMSDLKNAHGTEINLSILKDSLGNYIDLSDAESAKLPLPRYHFGEEIDSMQDLLCGKELTTEQFFKVQQALNTIDENGQYHGPGWIPKEGVYSSSVEHGPDCGDRRTIFSYTETTPPSSEAPDTTVVSETPAEPVAPEIPQETQVEAAPTIKDYTPAQKPEVTYVTDQSSEPDVVVRASAPGDEIERLHVEAPGGEEVAITGEGQEFGEKDRLFATDATGQETDLGPADTYAIVHNYDAPYTAPYNDAFLAEVKADTGREPGVVYWDNTEDGKVFTLNTKDGQVHGFLGEDNKLQMSMTGYNGDEFNCPTGVQREHMQTMVDAVNNGKTVAEPSSNAAGASQDLVASATKEAPRTAPLNINNGRGYKGMA